MKAMTIAAILLVIYTIIALLDGLYLHLWKYKLYTRQDSVCEHKLHTLRSMLFPFALYLLFARNFGGIVLWIGIILAAVDLIVGVLDVLEEKDSRKNMGGLSSFEYLLHMMAEGVHFSYLTLILIAKPVEAWGLSSATVLSTPYPLMVHIVFWAVLPGAIGAAFLHLWLLQKKYLEHS